MSLLHLAVFGILGAATAALGWLLTRRIIAMKPQAANLTTVALVAATFGGLSPLLTSKLDDWDAKRGAYQAGLQLYGNERAARAFAESMTAFLRDRPLLERLQKERASALQQSASQTGLANNQQALFAQLAARGLSRLPGEEADEFFATKRALADASPEICAGFWTGRTRPDAVMTALRRLPEDRQLVWIRASAHAAQLELHATKPVDHIQSALIDQASDHMIAALSPAPRAAYVKAASANAVTDDEACAAFQALGQGLDKLSVDERRLLVRAVTDPGIVDH